jgi:GNAT superfamily N-acetyltransferase
MDSIQFFFKNTNSLFAFSTNPKKFTPVIDVPFQLIVTFVLMTNKVLIRRATASDAANILQLIKELAAFEREPHAVVVTTADLIRDGFGDQPAFVCFVAIHNDDVVGMAFGYPRYSTWKGKTMHLEDLIVQEKHRGKGIGFALYKKFIHHAAAMKVRRIEWAVLDWNQPAIDFYVQTGANVLSDWRTAQMDEKAISQFINNHPDANI